MDQKSVVYTLDEFNHECFEGRIIEAAVSGPLQLIRISCSNFFGFNRSRCGAHLRDLWIVTIGGERRYAVGCGACGEYSKPEKPESYRRIGKQGYLNGN